MSGEQLQVSSRMVGESRPLRYSEFGVHDNDVTAAVPGWESESEKAVSEGLFDSTTSSNRML